MRAKQELYQSHAEPFRVLKKTMENCLLTRRWIPCSTAASPLQGLGASLLEGFSRERVRSSLNREMCGCALLLWSSVPLTSNLPLVKHQVLVETVCL